MRQLCEHEWVEDSEGIVCCFFCGKDGNQAARNFITKCVECGVTYLGSGGQGLCNFCGDRLGMHEEEIL